MALHKTSNTESQRICQGDIFSNISYIESYTESNGEFELSIIDFPYVLVLTQDCDLEQNFNERAKIPTQTSNSVRNEDKYLISLIVAPLYNEAHLIQGTHLKELKIQSQKQSSDLKKLIIRNQNPRYHYIEFPQDSGIPNSIIDFKHYFTVSLSTLEKSIEKRKCVVEPLYREFISQRFSNYLSRIGLPNPE